MENLIEKKYTLLDNIYLYHISHSIILLYN